MTPNTLMPQEASIPPEPKIPPDASSQPAPDPAFAIPSSSASAYATSDGKAKKSSKSSKSNGAAVQSVAAPALDSATAPSQAQSQAQIDAEMAARKRQEIGLTPRRNTAQSEVLRPPAQAKRSGAMQWLAMAGLAALALILTWMIATRLFASQPTVASLNAQFNALLDTSVTGAATIIANLSEDPASLLRPAGSLPISEEFIDDSGPLVRDFQPRRWSMGPVPDEGVYRIRMWPGIIAWSTLGVDPVAAYSLATDMTISAETPWGFGGLMARYSDPRNLLFAQIDGKGRYRMQMQNDGVWSTLQEWTEASIIQTAGLANTLTLVDNGAYAIFYVNGEAIYTTPELTLPAGDAGVLAGSLDPAVAEANFGRIEMNAAE